MTDRGKLRKLLAAAVAAMSCLSASAVEYLSDVSSAGQFLREGKFERLEAIHARHCRPAQRTVEHAVHCDRFFEGVGNALLAQAADDVHTQAWTQAYPNSSAAVIARANTLLARIRAQELSRNWGALELLLDHVDSLLKREESGSRGDVHWHLARLVHGTMQGWGPRKVRAALSDALAGQPYSPTLYEAGARYLARVSPDAVADLQWFAERASDATRAATGDLAYAQILVHGLYVSRALATDPLRYFQWQRVDAGLVLWREQSPMFVEAPTHLAIACLARDQARTAALLKTNILPHPYWFDRWGGRGGYERCKEWAQQPSTIKSGG